MFITTVLYPTVSQDYTPWETGSWWARVGSRCAWSPEWTPRRSSPWRSSRTRPDGSSAAWPTSPPLWPGWSCALQWGPEMDTSCISDTMTTGGQFCSVTYLWQQGDSSAVSLSCDSRVTALQCHLAVTAGLQFCSVTYLWQQGDSSAVSLTCDSRVTVLQCHLVVTAGLQFCSVTYLWQQGDSSAVSLTCDSRVTVLQCHLPVTPGWQFCSVSE